MTTETHNPKEAIAPEYIAFHVLDKEPKARWHRIGAFFAHQDGNGGTLILESLPIAFDGRIVLRTPIA